MAAIEIVNLQGSFKQAADTYELRMGMITRPVAHHIVSNIRIPPNARICDNACGTGAVMEAVLDKHPDATIDACDIAAPMAAIARAVSQDRKWADKVQVEVANSMKLPYSDEVFDANIMNFGIFFTPDPEQVVREIYRTIKPGGTAAITCWEDSAFFRLTWVIQDVVKPKNPVQVLPTFDEWKDPRKLKSIMEAAGFEGVEIQSVPVSAKFNDQESLIRYCAINIGSVVGDRWTPEEKVRLLPAIKEVIEREGDKHLTTDASGTIQFPWLACLATAIK